MVRDWCQYKGEGFLEDEDEGGEDLLSLLLLFNLDHCVDLIASRTFSLKREYFRVHNFQVILMSSPLAQPLECVLLGGGWVDFSTHCS